MSKTIAEKLFILSDGLSLINQEKNYQTELILNLQDTIEELTTPIPQTAPLISIDNTAGTITATVIQEQGGYVPMGTLNTTITAKHSIDTLLPGNIKAGVNILGVTGTMSSGIDTSDATAAAGDILSGKTAYVNGTKVTGNIATKTAADVAVKGAQVSIPFGYYSEPVNKYVTIAERATTTLGSAVSSNKMTFTATNAQTTGYVTADTSKNTATKTVSISASGKTVTATDGTNSISASVADGSATTPATTITSAPTISVDANGLITASNSKTQNVTPTISAGYVSSGTAGTITVSGSNTRQLVTKGATTYTPSTTN